jgi:hypothetical protein
VRDKYPAKPAEPVTESPTITVEVDGKPLGEPLREALNKASAADAATEALKAQIAALKRGEQMQQMRVQAGMMQDQTAAMQAKAAEWAQSPPSHKELLDHWETHFSMPKSERAFLEEHPELVDNRELTSRAALEAHQQGLERGTEAFNQAVLAGFHRHLQGAQRRQVERPAAPMLAPPERDAGSFVSAPVSREAPSAGDGSRNRPGRITLSTQERDFARSIGLSEENYAMQKLRLINAKATGDIPG